MTMWIPIRKVKLEDGDLKNGILHKQANIYIFSYMHARWAKVIRRDVFPIICYSKEERRRVGRILQKAVNKDDKQDQREKI